jgi:hypothetical protein
VKVMSSDGSFRVYRSHILGLDPPLVPYLYEFFFSIF